MRTVAIPANAYIRATLHLQRTEDGGRATPFTAGYRPGFALTGLVTDQYDAAIFLEDRDELAPGETGNAWLQPLSPEHWKHMSGRVIPFFEGARLIGTATVTEVLAESANGLASAQ
jgi:translation elongation factor EF-Tu-like GTPase